MDLVREATRSEVKTLRAIADYQFRSDVGNKFIPDNALLKISKNTGRIREVFTSDSKRIASIRASTFTFNLSLYGGSVLHKLVNGLRIIVANEVVKYVVSGGSLFSRHVLGVDEGLRAGDEVLVVNEDDDMLCVGRLALSPYEIMFFTRGVAVKLRECVGSVE
ncbi:MAG: PUA domain-containing protein [Sulfolobales archaeon]